MGNFQLWIVEWGNTVANYHRIYSNNPLKHDRFPGGEVGGGVGVGWDNRIIIKCILTSSRIPVTVIFMGCSSKD